MAKMQILLILLWQSNFERQYLRNRKSQWAQILGEVRADNR